MNFGKNFRWSPYRVILLFLVVVCLNADVVNDFDLIYKLQRDKCQSDPENYLQDVTSLMKCNISFAGACWPETPVDSTFIQSCPVLFFLPGGFINRRCNESGQWEKMDFTQCQKLTKNQALKIRKKLLCELSNMTCPVSKIDVTEELKQRYLNEDIIFLTFSWVSVTITFPALLLLVCIKDPSDSDRFSLHKNLLVAFLMKTLTYFIEYYGNLSLRDSLQTLCTSVWVLNRYFAVAEVTWITNEAIFFLRLLIRTYDYNSYFWTYFFFGWVLPAILTFAIYVPVSRVVYGTENMRCWSFHGQEAIMMILYAPMTLLLVINLCIMIYALCTLVIKMKETNTADGLIARNTTKGVLILIPQMGVIYLALFYIPCENSAFTYVVRVIVPLQGAFAALVFVIFNSDVREAVLLRWYQWQCSTNFDKRKKRSFDDGVFIKVRPPARHTALPTGEVSKQAWSQEPLDQSLVRRSSRESSPWMQPGMIEMKEIGRQKKDSEVILHPNVYCSQRTSIKDNLGIPATIPKRVIVSLSTNQPARKSSSPLPSPIEHLDGSSGPREHELDLFIRDRPIDTQLQSRAIKSSETGLEMEAEKYMPVQSDESFEEVIHLEDNPFPQTFGDGRLLPKRLVMARQSCPSICNQVETRALKEDLPRNIRKAFKGYGVCSKTKKLKEPARKQSASAYCNLHRGWVRPETRRLAWAEDVTAAGSKPAMKTPK